MAILKVKSEITGSLWKIVKAQGAHVEQDEPIMILESMKMEIPVLAPDAGTLKEILVIEGESVEEGQVVAVNEI